MHNFSKTTLVLFGTYTETSSISSQSQSLMKDLKTFNKFYRTKTTTFTMRASMTSFKKHNFLKIRFASQKDPFLDGSAIHANM